MTRKLIYNLAWKHSFSVPSKNRHTALNNILETCVLFPEYFFDRRLNVVNSVLMQSEIIKQSTYFSPDYIYVENLHEADFEFKP